MYCPRCGRESSETQRFCKSCGTNLISVTQALSGATVTSAQQADLQARLRDFSKGMKMVFIGMGLSAFFFFVSSSFKPVGIGLLVLFIGLGQMLRAMVSARPRLEVDFHLPGHEPVAHAPKRMPAPEDYPAVPSTAAPAPSSVTEDATLRLGADQYPRSEGK